MLILAVMMSVNLSMEPTSTGATKGLAIRGPESRDVDAVEGASGGETRVASSRQVRNWPTKHDWGDC